MDIVYRIADIDDAEELKRLNNEFNGDGCNSLDGIRDGLLREDAENVFVAELNHKLIGFCCGKMLKSICYSVFYTEITELYINTAFQKQGIGRDLINFAMDWYRQHNIHDFQLFTGQDNITAQKFYEHLGFRRSDEILYRKRDLW